MKKQKLCVSVITIICVTYVKKNFQIQTSKFNEAVIYKMSIYNEIAPNFTISQKS